MCVSTTFSKPAIQISVLVECVFFFFFSMGLCFYSLMFLFLCRNFFRRSDRPLFLSLSRSVFVLKALL